MSSKAGPDRLAGEHSRCIKPATPDDIPELASFLECLFSQEHEFQPDREKQVRGLRLILERPYLGRIFVIREGDILIGMVNLLFTVSTAEGGFVILLEDMFIRSEFRGRGFGSRLLRHVIDFARREGFARITLLTDGGENPARKFYLRHGFALSPMIPMRLQLRIAAAES